MVKEFDQDPTADVWIVLDLHAGPHRPATRPVNWVPDDRGHWPHGGLARFDRGVRGDRRRIAGAALPGGGPQRRV